jgi:DNA-binding IclR family transcriptional regulator
MAKIIKARKLDVLEFIMKRELIEAYELEERFGYSHTSVRPLLTRLKKAGLVINMTKDRWELTEEGYRKLSYFGRR